jgi:hypothetical protein
MHIDLIAGATRACSVTSTWWQLSRGATMRRSALGVLVGMKASVMIQMLLSLTGGSVGTGGGERVGGGAMKPFAVNVHGRSGLSFEFQR